MYAVIKTGGKQYRVAQGDRLKVELLDRRRGRQGLLRGADGRRRGRGQGRRAGGRRAPPSRARSSAHGKHKKLVHFRKKKEGWTKKRGHRQPFTELLITAVRG